MANLSHSNVSVLYVGTKQYEYFCYVVDDTYNPNLLEAIQRFDDISGLSESTSTYPTRIAIGYEQALSTSEAIAVRYGQSVPTGPYIINFTVDTTKELPEAERIRKGMLRFSDNSLLLLESLYRSNVIDAETVSGLLKSFDERQKSPILNAQRLSEFYRLIQQSKIDPEDELTKEFLGVVARSPEYAKWTSETRFWDEAKQFFDGYINQAAVAAPGLQSAENTPKLGTPGIPL